MADIELLGVFEDGPQRDFLITIVEDIGLNIGYDVVVEPRLTAGCRFDYLRDHFAIAHSFAGVIVGVDGAGLDRAGKIAELERRCPPPPLCLWAIAEPAIEEWMMADAEALPSALRELFGVGGVRYSPRPGKARAERTAKQRLREWVERLLGEPALQGGIEYAGQIAHKVSPARIGARRNGDFRIFLDLLPDFLHACSSSSE